MDHGFESVVFSRFLALAFSSAEEVDGVPAFEHFTKFKCDGGSGSRRWRGGLRGEEGGWWRDKIELYRF